jgi:hypothetical protein
MRCFYALALKCDLRDDPDLQRRLAKYGARPCEYEEGLAVARRIRASRYLGECKSWDAHGVGYLSLSGFDVLTYGTCSL